MTYYGIFMYAIFFLQEKRFAKMEKADILEMTIGHLVEIHQQKIGM